MAIVRAACAAADAGACVTRAWASVGPAIESAQRWRLLAAGKAAGPMVLACLAHATLPPDRAMAVAASRPAGMPDGVEFFAGGHPTPSEGSVWAGQRALEIASSTMAADVLVVLLSGGASALLEYPADGVTLADLRDTTNRLLRAGADIAALNAVRKHLSRVKGGQLAAVCRGRLLALVVSDVVGDDLSVIASGPTVADPSTFSQALDVLRRFGGAEAFPAAVVRALARGARGGRQETPKPGSPDLDRATTIVVGAARDALNGARGEAEARGYDVHLQAAPVTGEARLAARAFADRLRGWTATRGRGVCVLSGGETTVTVKGPGRGGRNQEFALALAAPLERFAGPAVVASIGTDGIDGPTDAAGAIVDTSTVARALAAGIGTPETYLRDNDSYTFFQALGDLVVTGPTGTNVGDIQVALLVPEVAT